MQNEPKHYEFSFIIPGNVPEDQHPEIFNKIKSLLEKKQVQNLAVTLEIGRKKLSYPIKHLRHGFYFSWEFDLLPKDLNGIERELKINKDILRYIIINKRIKTAKEIAQEEKVKDIQIQKQLTKEKEAVEEKPEKKVKVKISLDDLDKKLDELLNEEVK